MASVKYPAASKNVHQGVIHLEDQLIEEYLLCLLCNNISCVQEMQRMEEDQGATLVQAMSRP